MNQTDQTPNLTAYLSETEVELIYAQHTTAELLEIDKAFGQIEAAMITIRRNAEIPMIDAIWLGITTIWDNSRDLIDDED